MGNGLAQRLFQSGGALIFHHEFQCSAFMKNLIASFIAFDFYFKRAIANQGRIDMAAIDLMQFKWDGFAIDRSYHLSAAKVKIYFKFLVCNFGNIIHSSPSLNPKFQMTNHK